MILTDDILMNDLGFETNHPDYKIKKFYKHGKNPEYRVMVDCEYNTLNTKLVYNVSMWKCNENGAIIKRASLSDVTTSEELQSICALCGISI